MEFNEDSNMGENVYDVLLSKCKEPKYMKPIRNLEKRMGFVTPIRWIDSIFIVTIHVTAIIYVLNVILYGWPKWQSVLFVILLVVLSGFGVTAGVHRYWTHRSYKAKWPLKLILVICYSIAGQNPIGAWVLDHRVHHKYSDTSGDPHNAKRGLFFSHVGWLMMKKHPDVKRNGKKMDMSDIEQDPFVKFHTRYFMLFKVMLCWVLPSLVPWLAWGETLSSSILSQAVFRYVYTLNGTWTVNSLAHFYGYKPFDPKIKPSENQLVSKITFGEGWHNYHHTFPWDYKAAEFGASDNLTTTFLEFFAWVGWAYDMKEATPELVKSVVESRRKGVSDDIGYVVYSALGSFYIPSCIMVFVYIRIYFAAKARARRGIRKNPRPRPNDQQTSFSNPPKGTRPMPVTHPMPSGHLSNNNGESQISTIETPQVQIPTVTCELASDISTSEAGDTCPPSFDERKDTLKVVTSAQVTKNPLSSLAACPLRSSTLSVNGELALQQNRARAPSVAIDADMVSEMEPSSSDSGVVSRCGGVKPLKLRLFKKTDRRQEKSQPSKSELEPALPKPHKPRDPEREKKRLARKKEKRATLILGLIMGSFIACWLPFFFLYILKAACRNCSIPESAFAIAFWLGYMNSVLNPVIYTIFNKDFRRAFRRILFK